MEHRKDDLDRLTPSWVEPVAPAGYAGPGVINPYSNVNPLNPMAAEMQSRAAGQARSAPPAPGPFDHFED